MRGIPLLLALLLLLSACDLAGGLATLSDKEPTLPSFTTEAPVSSAPSSTEPSEEISSAPLTDHSSTAEIPQSTDIPSSTDSEGYQALSLLSMTETVGRGETASVTVSGLPDITYTITVRYPSSVSTAAGLEPKTADADGKMTWSWRVGSRTSLGVHRIVIEGGGERLTLTFTVTE